jgi:HTH-type transcriptional regulator/antitoxin HigA
MAERGIPQRELAACFGSQPNCSAVLNRRRGLTLPMIRGLHEKLGIPADLLIRECRRRGVRSRTQP